MSKIARRISLMFKCQRKSWQQFANEMGAEFIENGMLHPFQVKKEFENNTIVLTTFSKLIGRTQMTGTIYSTTCTNTNKTEFILTRKTLLNKLLKNGFQKVDIANPEFSKLFVIYGSNYREIKRIFDAQLIHSIQGQTPYNDLTIELIKTKATSEIKLTIYPVIKDVNQLKSLFDIVQTVSVKVND